MTVVTVPGLVLHDGIDGALRVQQDSWREQTDAERLTDITPVDFSFPPFHVCRYGAVGDGYVDCTEPIEDAIAVAAEAVAGGIGSRVLFPPGEFIVSSQINLPNRVGLRGASSRGTSIKAWASHTGPYMFEASNGTTAMFGSIVEDLQIDANNVAGLGCILSKAWQENSGPRRCVILNFRTYGIRYQDGYGGASYTRIEDTEIFASGFGALAGIHIAQISLVGSFKLHIIGSVLSGGGSINLPIGLNAVNDSTMLEGVHWEGCDVCLNAAGSGNHMLLMCDGSSTATTTLVELASNYTGTLRMLNCRRAGAAEFIRDDRANGVGVITADYDDIRLGSGVSFYRSGVGSPSGSVTPLFIGEEYLATGGPNWYKSTGLGNTNWVALN